MNAARLTFGIEAPGLDHESGYDAIEHGAVEMALDHIAQKIGHRYGSVLAVELEDDFAQRGLERDFRRRVFGGKRGARRQDCPGEGGQLPNSLQGSYRRDCHGSGLIPNRLTTRCRAATRSASET